MKDIKYFLEAERNYNQTPIPDMVYIEGIGYEYPEEPLHFLRRKPFSSLEGISTKSEGMYGLNAVEWLMLHCFLGPFSEYFRSDNYHAEIPEVVKEMQLVLDSAIRKAPKCNNITLYRFLNDFDKRDFQIGEIFTPSHSLTTTTEDWGKDTDMYLITSLPTERTKAHSLYKIYNHGNETQVNFERESQFRIVDIKRENNRWIIFLNEEEKQ